MVTSSAGAADAAAEEAVLEAVELEEPPQAARPSAAAPTPATFRKLRREIRFSLGAVLALNYAIDHPDKVKALVLIAAQYKMPKKLLKFQNMLFRFMPNAMFKQFGFKKADVISLCGTMTELDFRDSLCKVSCPALIVCGEKDNANKKASKELASYLSDSHFHELLKAGHEANIESPEELATVLQEFYDNVE